MSPLSHATSIYCLIYWGKLLMFIGVMIIMPRSAKVKRFLQNNSLDFLFTFDPICDIIEQRKGGGIGEFQGNYK